MSSAMSLNSPERRRSSSSSTFSGSPQRRVTFQPSSHTPTPACDRTPKSQSPSPAKEQLTKLEKQTILNQRRELELVIGELKDRDRELNEMMASHQRQIAAYDDDHKRAIIFEDKCFNQDRELQQKTELLRATSKRLKALQANYERTVIDYETTRQRLDEMSEEHKHKSAVLRDTEMHNESLNKSLMDTSASCGELEAREKELLLMLKVKEEDLVQLDKRSKDLAGKLKTAEHTCRQLDRIGSDLKGVASEWKEKFLDVRKEADDLKAALHLKQASVDNKTHELEKALREVAELKTDLGNLMEKERRNEEMLVLQRSKQERTDAELTSLRKIYDQQQGDLHQLYKNLENSKELLERQQASFEQGESDFLLSDLSPSSYPRYTSPTMSESRSRHSPSPTRTSRLRRSDRLRGGSTEEDGIGESEESDGGSEDTDVLVSQNHSGHETKSPRSDDETTEKLRHMLSECKKLVPLSDDDQAGCSGTN